MRSAHQQRPLGGRARKCPAFHATHDLPKDSVANVSQIVTLDKTLLTERVGKLPRAKLHLLLSGIDVVLGR